MRGSLGILAFDSGPILRPSVTPVWRRAPGLRETPSGCSALLLLHQRGTLYLRCLSADGASDTQNHAPYIIIVAEISMYSTP